jgi:hypothetical protein
MMPINQDIESRIISYKAIVQYSVRLHDNNNNAYVVDHRGLQLIFDVC